MADKYAQTLTVEELTAAFEFLDALRKSGVTNMFGAAPYLAKGYGLDMPEARSIHTAWIETFSTAETAEQRAEAYLPE